MVKSEHMRYRALVLLLAVSGPPTKGLDVWIDSSAENAERVYRSLLKFGAPLAGLTAKDFAEEGSFYQMGIPPVRVDILMSMDGVGWARPRHRVHWRWRD